MDFKPTRSPESDAGPHRTGESRFGHGAGGTWVDKGPTDGSGRTAGWYKASEGTVTGLTVVRPATVAPVAAPKASISKPNAPRAVNLPGGHSGVLLFHGLSSTPLELQYLGRGLHRAGHTVRIAVIEGYSHGMPSPSQRNHKAWAEAAVAEFDRMRQHCDTLAVGGLCIGALLSLHVAASRPAAVSHVLALATTLHYDGWAAPWTRWMLPLARILPWTDNIASKEREPFGLKDERLRAWIAAQMKESGGSDAGAAMLKVRDLLEAQNLMRVVRQGLKRISAPTLLVHARDDDVATPRSAFEVAAGVSSSRVHCVLLNDSYHMISIDKEKTRVLAEMKDFLQVAKPGAEAPDNSAGLSATPTVRRSEHVRA